PKALLKYQDADAILAANTRKELVDELSTALSRHQISILKEAWKSGRPVIGGEIPDYGETDTDQMYRLLNQYTVLEMALKIADRRFGNVPLDRDKHAKNLILTEDFQLMSELAKHARTAIQDYDDHGIACLIAYKRVSDFKRALSLRTTTPMDSPGTYGWISLQDEKNEQALGKIPSFDELFAHQAVPDLVSRM
ncbi:MAG: glutamate synthase large subunit, partial [Planctomycetota bacterium]